MCCAGNVMMKGSVGWVVVLGDLGRSPRMQYHISSLLKRGVRMHAVAYTGSNLIPFLANHGMLTVHAIREPPSWLSKLPRLMSLILKAAIQLLSLMYVMLLLLPKPGFMLVQLPPSIPTLMVCWVVKHLRGIPLVYDWHNFGYSLMAMSMGGRKLFVRCARILEMTFGRFGDFHMCVTRAMKEELSNRWRIDAVVLYDRPPEMFRRSSLEELDALMKKLTPAFSLAVHGDDFCTSLLESIQNRDPLTYQEESLTTIREWGGEVALRPERPGIVVSSTSWTVDEDFSLLLDAACLYDMRVKEFEENGWFSHPKLLFIITGKGPLREYYLEEMRKRNVTHVAFRTVWLEPEDYPRLLGCADLGVSLHSSSSNLDLPMKIVDMFGSGLPVCALGYNCLSELVEDGKTGLVFGNVQELADQLVDLFASFPSGEESEGNKLEEMKKKVMALERFKWEDNWEHCALPIIKKAQASRGRSHR